MAESYRVNGMAKLIAMLLNKLDKEYIQKTWEDHEEAFNELVGRINREVIPVTSDWQNDTVTFPDHDGVRVHRINDNAGWIVETREWCIED